MKHQIIERKARDPIDLLLVRPSFHQPIFSETRRYIELKLTLNTQVHITAWSRDINKTSRSTQLKVTVVYVLIHIQKFTREVSHSLKTYRVAAPICGIYLEL